MMDLLNPLRKYSLNGECSKSDKSSQIAACPLFEAVKCQGENVIAVLLADVRSRLYLRVIVPVKSDTISQCQDQDDPLSDLETRVSQEVISLLDWMSAAVIK